MKKRVALSVVLAFMLLAGSHAMAAAPLWKIDPAHSNIYFGVHHIYSTVKGHFNDFQGSIKFDPDHLKDSRFDFKVKVGSIDTNNGERDKHLQSADFFDVDQYPEMTFKSTSIVHKTGDQYEVDGVLTIKDVSKSLKIPFTYPGSRQHPLNPKWVVAGFDARMTIDRLVYHVGSGKFYQMGAVGKDVKVFISVEATREE
jgi:polyisoprenoid-binding protein YceI